ncbi:penicillin-binding transpeptidase domain-containing protein (plasmid) [Embleya sp. NBC_00888]|uniref:peptidoglycan D,D-transpeptidase FtsI family protein n=1 Tax=Embleya sp. NBC_00888 TaxID=2975960 RepID=UPI002F916286|nr:penicillin-binding transpeptidase domain-containing protein [Embleya sp. NBC_00888]
MNKPLRRVSVFCLILVAALMLRANWVQVVKADDYATDSHNKRAIYEKYSHPRGDFLVEGKPITSSVKTDDKQYEFLRKYEFGPMYAPVTGYISPFVDKNFLESIDDDILSGKDSRLFVRKVLDTVTNKGTRGGNVALTINAKAQEAAYNGLKDKTGAAVAIDPETGKVLAMVSTPSYDPNVLAQNDRNAVAKAYDQLTLDTDKNRKKPDTNFDPRMPMENRPIRKTYPPGSTFKLITAAAALSENRAKPGDAPRVDLKGADHTLFYPSSNEGLSEKTHPGCVGATLQRALELSCNTVFAQLGTDVGPAKLREQAERFGFNNFGKGEAQKNALYIPSRVVDSKFPAGLDAGGQTMRSAIGQDSVTATPMEMAMVVAGIVNQGRIMKPYVVDELRAQNLSVIEKTQPEVAGTAVSPEVAQQLKDMMVGVVANPGATGAPGAIQGVTVGAKTGTAQQGVANSKPPYAWFVSFAEADGKKVAVAVVIEPDSTGDIERDDIGGGKLAGPIAKAIMEAVVQK